MLDFADSKQHWRLFVMSPLNNLLGSKGQGPGFQTARDDTSDPAADSSRLAQVLHLSVFDLTKLPRNSEIPAAGRCNVLGMALLGIPPVSRPPLEARVRPNKQWGRGVSETTACPCDHISVVCWWRNRSHVGALDENADSIVFLVRWLLHYLRQPRCMTPLLSPLALTVGVTDILLLPLMSHDVPSLASGCDCTCD